MSQEQDQDQDQDLRKMTAEHLRRPVQARSQRWVV